MSGLDSLPRIPGNPLFGNLLEFRSDRFGFLTTIHPRHGAIVRGRHGVFNVVYSADADFSKEVMVDHADAFAKGYGLSVFMRPMLGHGLLTSEGAFHKKQRRMMSPAFAHKRIAEYADIIAARAVQTDERFVDGARIDLSEELMRMTLEIVGKTLFDAEVGSEAAEIGEAITAAMHIATSALNSLVPLPPSVPTPGNLRAKKHVARLDETVYRLIRERRADGTDHGDFLSMLLVAQDEDDGTVMTDKQVRDEAMNIFLAGHETTANALAWVFYLLAQHPDVRDRLEVEVDAALGGRAPTLADLANLPYAMQVFKESMRLYPPAYIISRRATRDVEICGVMVPKDQLILINIVGMHHEAKYFPEPWRFDPDRFSAAREKQIPKGAYTPFAAGPRVCIGNHFALMEGQIAVATLAQRARFELPIGSARVVPEPLVTLRPKGGMPMIVRRRQPGMAVAAE